MAISPEFPLFSVFKGLIESFCEAHSYMHLTGSLIACLRVNLCISLSSLNVHAHGLLLNVFNALFCDFESCTIFWKVWGVNDLS